MSTPHALKPGDKLPTMQFPPITRATLALYCGGSGDHNPIHVDIDYAKASGLDDVIAHGMLIKAYIGRALTAIINQEQLAVFDTQFMAPTRVGDEITVTAQVETQDENDQPGQLVITAQAKNQHGVVVAKSQATCNRG